MNEPSTSSFFVVLLFILRCLVPLAILFGISYLLRRMGLIAVETPEPYEEADEKSTEDSGRTAASKKLTSTARSEKLNQRKASPPRKKTAAKKRTGNPRSRSK
jgi:hypothetical protein